MGMLHWETDYYGSLQLSKVYDMAFLMLISPVSIVRGCLQDCGEKIPLKKRVSTIGKITASWDEIFMEIVFENVNLIDIFSRITF